MNEQFETAYNIFKDYYGSPKWEIDPKEGQRPDVIIRQWCEALEPYTVDQIRQACGWLTRKRRVMTFPSLDTLLAELCGTEKENRFKTKGEEALYCYNYILQHANESTPPISKEAAQKTIWDLYGIAMDGYDPEEKQDVDLHPHAMQDEFAKMFGYVVKKV